MGRHNTAVSEPSRRGSAEPAPGRGAKSFVTLGGRTFAVTSGARASTRRKLTLRFGKLVDRDTTPFDGSRNIAFSHETCAKGERVISGGIRQTAGGAGVVPSISTVESGSVPNKRGRYVSMSSDLGGPPASWTAS